MQVFSGWSLTIFIFRVFLLLQLNIYWEVNFGVQHFLCGCIPQSSRYLKPHLDAVIAKPHLTDSGQCTKVKPMVGFLRPLSPSERADSQQVQGRALNSWWDIVSDRLGHGTGEWELSVLWFLTVKWWEELEVWWARSQQERGGWRETLIFEGSQVRQSLVLTTGAFHFSPRHL